MKPRIALYLAGSIKKDHEVNPSFWSEQDIHLLKTSLPRYDVALLNPAFRTDDLSDSTSVFGRDMLQVFSSNVVFVDARDRRGLGVGAEMMWAKLNNIPVVTWAPKNSHYNKSHAKLLDVSIDNYIHPFVWALSDQIVDTLPEGAAWIENYISNPSSVKVKGIDHISSTMEYYKAKQLSQDEPMKKLLCLEDELTKRMNRPHPQLA